MRKWIKTQIFEKHRIHEHPSLERFADILMREQLWQVNRRSISLASAIGLFCAFLPIPFQMVVAFFIALPFRANVFLAVALVWISNPITIPIIFYFCYKVGQMVLGRASTENDSMVEEMDWLSFEWMGDGLADIAWPLLVGSLIVGVIASVLGYIAVQIIWRLRIMRYARSRKLRHKAAQR